MDLCTEINRPIGYKLLAYEEMLEDNPKIKTRHILENPIKEKYNNIIDLAKLQLKREGLDFNDYMLVLDRADKIISKIRKSKRVKELYDNIF